MAILEINLEKPALVEEYQYPGGTTVGKTKPGESSRGDRSSSGGGGKGKLVGLLAVLAGVGLLAWRLKRRGSTEQSDFEDFEEQSQEYEHGPEPEIGGDEGGAKRKVASVLGLVVALVSVVAAVRKARS